jgi:DNA mismatch repair protein MutS2
MRATETLEFNRIRDEIAAYASTAAGYDHIHRIEPLHHVADIRSIHAPVRHLLARLEKGEALPTGDVADVVPLFDAVEREGAVLETDELLEIKRFLLFAGEIVAFCHAEEENALSILVGDIVLPESLLKRLKTTITDDGEISEAAIPELKHLKSEIGRVNRALIRRSDEMMRDNPQIYHGEQATIRDGRVVLPLAANFKGRIDGIIHEASGSGETLFVEPRDLVDLNNELIQTHHAIHQEIRRVVRELSAIVRECLPNLRVLLAAVVHIDTLIARARWGFDRGGVIPGEGESIDLRNARHPLLGDACVPLSIAFDRDVRMLVISGPNTGGKTVLIKTVGLLTMLNQIGVPIPVSPESSLPFFSYWGVDIGDEQSIDESLSTFSSHMRNIAEVLDNADGKSLILLDELGSGTDPEEGAALSMAIVDSLIDRGCTILVSTHQTLLKHYGYTREGAQNVSMAFDAETHRPTYRVVPGRPGASHAIETAREQGVSPAVISAAEGYAGDAANSVSEIINRLLEEERRIAELSREIEEREKEVEQRRVILSEKQSQLDQRESELRSGKIADLDREIREARRKLEGEIRRIRELGRSVERDDIKTVHQTIEDVETVRRRHEVAAKEMAARPDPAGAVPSDLSPGDTVRHRRTQREGVVKSVEDNSAEVQFGAIRMTVSLSDIVFAPSQQGAAKKGASVGKGATGTNSGSPGKGVTSTAVFELDIRGKRLHEAIDEVERQVDAAVLRGLNSFSIIHGTGTGVLQKGVHDYLKGRSEVGSFRFARPEAGGFGKTMVELSGDDR